MGRVRSGPGSQASPEAARASSPIGFDPSRALRFPQIEYHAPTILQRVRDAIAASKAARDYGALIGGAVKAARKDRLRPRRRGK